RPRPHRPATEPAQLNVACRTDCQSVRAKRTDWQSVLQEFAKLHGAAMSLLPYPFLFRVAYRCRYIKNIPQTEGDDLLDLPDACRLERLLPPEGQRYFADVR